MYETGEGVPENDPEAVRWFRLAADQGDADAQSNLGVMYANGEGVLEDDPEAVKWLRLAADQGVVAAQFNLGVMYANGGGLPEDYVLGYAWLNLAATARERDGPRVQRRPPRAHDRRPDRAGGGNERYPFRSHQPAPEQLVQTDLPGCSPVTGVCLSRRMGRGGGDGRSPRHPSAVA